MRGNSEKGREYRGDEEIGEEEEKGQMIRGGAEKKSK